MDYNTYYLALGVRTITGQIQWVWKTYPAGIGDIQFKKTRIALIDTVNIKEASITRALIKDLAVSSAKIDSLDARKIFVGDTSVTDLPYFRQCKYDRGDKCELGYPEYRTGGCPTSYAASGLCYSYRSYTPGEFSLERYFTYSADPTKANELTYIHGGFIATDSIVARSIQVGALPYVLELEVKRLFTSTFQPDEYVSFQWGKPGDLDNSNGHIQFANGDSYEIARGSALYFISTSSATRFYVGHIDIKTPSSPKSVAVTDFGYPPSDFTTQLYSQGRIPLFTVYVVKNPSSAAAIINGNSDTEIKNAVEGNAGQFKVEIQVINTAVVTYIHNNDITTGVIHNEYWSSFLDMRLYTGLNAPGQNYK